MSSTICMDGLRDYYQSKIEDQEQYIKNLEALVEEYREKEEEKDEFEATLDVRTDELNKAEKENEKLKDKLQEKSMKLYDLSRENVELREACMKKYVVPADVQEQLENVDDQKEYSEVLVSLYKGLKEENKKLKEKLTSIQKTIRDVL